MRIVTLVALCLLLAAPPARAALSQEDQEILERGPISKGRYITSGIVGTAVGFGIGHAIQKRYVPLGLVFTLGEVAAASALLVDTTTTLTPAGSRDARLGTVAIVGLVALIGLHVWEVVDIWVGGDAMRTKYEEVQRRAGKHAARELLAAPVVTAGGHCAAGLTVGLRF